MTAHWSNPATMKAIIFVCQLFLIIRSNAQNLPEGCVTSDTNRPPENSDIVVTCGTQYMDLEIYLCPMYNANYNESLMILNGQTNDECRGVADFDVDPPVLRFKLSIEKESLDACNNVFKTINQAGQGDFSSFSNVQYINVSGMVVSYDPASGLITYRPSITYLYSCQYPLQYVLNNTEVAVAGVNLAINENNGSFISTLSMKLYTDDTYLVPLIIPSTGLNLKDRIFVEVTATNLTDQFNVLLDRCFATVGQYEDYTSGYDLFVGCTFDPQTELSENGISQRGRFSFEAFRFIVHKDLAVSTFFIHCLTTLCNVSMCDSMLPNCDSVSQRRRRDVTDDGSTTVTSPAILVGQHVADSDGTQSASVTSEKSEYSSPMVAVIVCVSILSLMMVGMGAYFTWSLRQNFRL